MSMLTRTNIHIRDKTPTYTGFHHIRVVYTSPVIKKGCYQGLLFYIQYKNAYVLNVLTQKNMLQLN